MFMKRKLLIIGAGGHGQVVSEVAEDCGYTDIAFIDDNSEKAIGRISDLENFKEEYADAFIGIGNNKLREQLSEKIKEIGFSIVKSHSALPMFTKVDEGAIYHGINLVYDLKNDKNCTDDFRAEYAKKYGKEPNLFDGD